jgi:hypothetical protein
MAPSTVLTTRHGDHQTDDQTIANMTNITELPKLLKKEFMMPDLIFDTKLLKKELLIHKKIYREKRQSWDKLFEQQCSLTSSKQMARQKTYILMDVSASTEINQRLVIEKAVAIAYLESNQKERGEVFFRAFHHETGPLHHCSDPREYQRLINSVIMNTQPMGRTDLQGAILAAFEDLNHHPSDHPAEILILTDGLSPLDLDFIYQNPPPSKIHVVLVGGDRPDLRDGELREIFNDIHKSKVEHCNDVLDPDERQKLQNNLDQLFIRNKGKIKSDHLALLEGNLESLAKRSGGSFIHIPDLKGSLTCTPEQAQHMESRIVEIESLLKNESTTVLDKEQLLDELLALRSYLNDLSLNSDDHELTQRFEALIQKTGDITLDSEELEAMLENLEVRISRNTQQQKGPDISVSQMLHIAWRVLKRKVKKSFKA